MSLIVKGIDMPKYKGEHKNFDRYGCFLTVYKNGEVELHVFENDYTIEEIPTPHGRLVDADATIARLKHLYCDGCGCDCSTCPWGAIIKYVDGRPTIIEAEK